MIVLLAVVSSTVGCFRLPGGKHNLPPAQMLMEPGPGVGGPGPGVMGGQSSMMLGGPGGGGYAGPGCYGGDGGGMYDPAMMMAMTPRSSQVYFVGPDGTQVNWDIGGGGGFESEPLVAPGRQNFPQGAIYRLKLSKIPGRQGVELYPTVEVAPANPRTEAFLAHNPIPIEFSEEDFDQVATSNFVTKVIYVPDAEFQELAMAGVQTLVSSRLDPGADPIAEADRRGSILAIVRLGNIDLETPDGQGAEVMDGLIQPAGYTTGALGGPTYGGPGYGGAPMAMNYGYGGPMPMGPGAPPIAGVTVNDWGMPMTGTPIGLPGPPHIPLGNQAGLRTHQITNRTHMSIPDPVSKIDIKVKQNGMSYPKPPSHVRINERSYAPGMNFPNPFANKLQQAP
ncbi:MAG: hypothetical protein WD875_18490 [Pirellulales bacterium]